MSFFLKDGGGGVEGVGKKTWLFKGNLTRAPKKRLVRSPTLSQFNKSRTTETDIPFLMVGDVLLTTR